MKSGRRKLPTDPGGRPVIYWDTCVLLAWMQDEKREAGEMERLEEVADLIRKDRVVLVTATLTRAEVLKGKVSKHAMARMDKLFRRSNVIPLTLDSPVSILTSEIRDYYNESDFELLTPDAIHLATAIHHGASEFHTFDGCNEKRKPRNPKYSRCGLLLLDGDVAGRRLKICKPSADQFGLFTNVGPMPTENVPNATEKANQPIPTKLPGSGDGSPQNQAATEDAKAGGNGQGSEGIADSETFTP